jgi:hypothetical protein
MKTIELNEEETNNPIKEIKGNKINQINETSIKPSKNNYFPIDDVKKVDEGFAMLRCANWGYYIKKLYCIIGYKPIKHDNVSNKCNTTWEVDVDLGHIKNVSKQHALIVYNFQIKSFEIKNLSKKFPIRVNGVQMNYNEEMPLSHKSIINIGNQEIFFLLPD